MNPKIIEFVQEWIAQAESDLKWAKASFGDGFYSQVCFVCQQVAEKALKGYLYGHKVEEKTHKLKRLVDVCVKIDGDFGVLKKELVVLEPYYVESRYPDAGEISKFQDKEVAQEAIEKAEKVLKFVQTKIGEGRG